MEKQLSKRLERVASFVQKGQGLLDVGSDHAYLPIFLVEKGLVPFAIAGEVVEGPFQSAQKNVAKHGLTDKIQVRLASGLKAYQEDDQVSNLVIAGMGGRLIADILAADLAKASRFDRLILQPNNREDELRIWLCQHHFKIEAEVILEEAGKIYEILQVTPGPMQLTDHEVRFGPFLIEEKSPVFVQKWEKEKAKLKWALDQIPDGHTASRKDLESKIKAIEEVLHVS